MIRDLLCIIALLFCAAATAGNDIWASLFRETLQQARQGDSEAQYDVGAMYQNGRGVPWQIATRPSSGTGRPAPRTTKGLCPD